MLLSDFGVTKRVMSPEGLAKTRTRHLNSWLQEAIKKHGSRFSYEEVGATFERQKGPPVIVFCQKHKERLLVTPFNHLRSKSGGCAKCDVEGASDYFRKREEPKFLEWFEENLSDRLELRSKFEGMTGDIKIFCKKHRSEKICKPTELMHAGIYGCTECASERGSEGRRLKINKIKDLYTDSMPDNITILGLIFDKKEKKSLLRIRCEFHGDQNMTHGSFNRSRFKCSLCGRQSIGYAGNRLKLLLEKNTPGVLTILAVMTIEVFGIEGLKVGVTTRSLEERYKWHLKNIHFEVSLSEREAYILENKIHREFRKKHDLRIMMKGMRSGKRWAGDSEIYFPDQRGAIIDFIKNTLSSEKIDYENEIKLYEIPKFFERDVAREKNLVNLPKAIVAVAPFSNEAVYSFESIAAAQRAGYFNVSAAVASQGKKLAGGLRWFSNERYEKGNLPPILPNAYAWRPVVCIEENKRYRGASEAAAYLKSQGLKVSASRITVACRVPGRRAGGFTWRYVDDTSL